MIEANGNEEILDTDVEADIDMFDGLALEAPSTAFDHVMLCPDGECVLYTTEPYENGPVEGVVNHSRDMTADEIVIVARNMLLLAASMRGDPS